MKEKEEAIIQEIEKEKEAKKRIPKEVSGKINGRVFNNIFIAIIIMLFFFLVILGFFNIERNVLVTDLKVFSIGILIISLLLFEHSYRKEDGKLCIYGIEILLLALVTLVSVYLCILMPNKFILIMASLSYLFAIYYVGKAILIYRNMKKEYEKSLSDIEEIVKKEKPEKKENTTKKRKTKQQEETTVESKVNKTKTEGLKKNNKK